MDIILKIDIFIYIQFIYKIIGCLTQFIKKCAEWGFRQEKEKISKKVDERIIEN